MSDTKKITAVRVVAIPVTDPADAVALHSDLREHGVEVSELPRWDGVPPMFSLLDPDGNRLYVSSP